MYSFYPANNAPYSVPYHHSPSHNTTPNNTSSAGQVGPGRTGSNPGDRPSFIVNGRPASPPRTGPMVNPSHTPTQKPAPLPPRQPSSSYDTRPPPTTATSGFASINAPQTSGFATINARSIATPPTTHAGLVKQPDPENKTPVSTQVIDNGMNNPRMYGYGETPTGTPAPPSTTTKRTPSTTHPYQMSEAFANRHHHCERVDSLNRGIWTSYGPLGTQEQPTGACDGDVSAM